MKQQFVLNYAIRQTTIAALPDSWVTNTFCQNLVSTKKKITSHIFVKTLDVVNS
jgi:hypothetical protein